MYEPYTGNDNGLKYYESIYIGLYCKEDPSNNSIELCNYIDGMGSLWMNMEHPDVLPGNYCVVASRNYSNNYKWRTEDCSAKRGIVCGFANLTESKQI